MARPRRETKQLFFDQFADFPLDEQAIVLDMLAEQHRQAKRQAAKKKEPSDKDLIGSQATLVDTTTGKLIDTTTGKPVEDLQ